MIYLTREELCEFDATDPSKPIYVGVNMKIFDVSGAKSVYGVKGK